LHVTNLVAKLLIHQFNVKKNEANVVLEIQHKLEEPVEIRTLRREWIPI